MTLTKEMRSMVIRHTQRKVPPEDDISNICTALVLDAQELRSHSARMHARNKDIRRVETKIADLEAQLQQLYVRRDRLRAEDSRAHAILVSKLITKDAVEDDLSVLSTDYIPNKVETDEINARLRARQQHINCMEQVIYSATTDQVVRDRLLARVDVLKRSCAVGQTILAPIRKLPAELLGGIFAHAVPSLRLDQLIDVHGNGCVPLDYMEPHPQEVRSRISRVCRRWNTLVQDTPRVWRTLALDYPLPEDIHIVEKWIKNSKACKLDIFVMTPHWYAPGNEALVSRVLELIHKELHRIRIFHSHGHNLEFISSIFPLGSLSNASSMEICSIERTADGDEAIGLGTVEAPRLKTLALVGVNQVLSAFSPASLSQLHSITIGLMWDSPASVPWGDWLEIFARCPLLETLCCSFGILAPYEHSPRLTLPALRKISICSPDILTFTQILESFHFPELTTLELHAYTAEPSASDILDSLSDNDAAPICSLYIVGMSFTGEGAERAMKKLKTISCINFRRSDIDGAFFTALLPVMSAGPTSWTCPKLSTIILDQSEIIGTELIRLIETRTLPDIANWEPHYFTWIVVERCFGLEPDHIEHLRRVCETRPRTFRFSF